MDKCSKCKWKSSAKCDECYLWSYTQGEMYTQFEQKDVKVEVTEENIEELSEGFGR